MIHLLLKGMRYDDCTAQASTRPFIVSVKRQYFSLTQLWAFFRCVPLGTLHPRLALSDASVFSFPWRRLRCAAPVTHQDQGLVTSRYWARRLPLASSMPQKTLGSLPCPIVYSVQIVWLPRGPPFPRLTAEASQHAAMRRQAMWYGLRQGLIRSGGCYPTFPPASCLNPMDVSDHGVNSLKINGLIS